MSFFLRCLKTSLFLELIDSSENDIHGGLRGDLGWNRKKDGRGEMELGARSRARLNPFPPLSPTACIPPLLLDLLCESHWFLSHQRPNLWEPVRPLATSRDSISTTHLFHRSELTISSFLLLQHSVSPLQPLRLEENPSHLISSLLFFRTRSSSIKTRLVKSCSNANGGGKKERLSSSRGRCFELSTVRQLVLRV